MYGLDKNKGHTLSFSTLSFNNNDLTNLIIVSFICPVPYRERQDGTKYKWNINTNSLNSHLSC